MKARQILLVLTIAVALTRTTNAADYTMKAGSTSRSIYVQVTGALPAAASYVRAQGTATSFLSTELTDVDSAWSSGKWKVVEGDGWGALVRIDLPNAALAAGAPSVSILVADDGSERRHVTIDLVGYDPTAAVLPANLVQVDGVNNGTHASGYVGTDVRNYGGTAGSFSGGRPEVNLTHAGGTAIGAEGTANFRHFLTDGYGPLLYRGTITAVTSSTVFTISGATFADVSGLINGGTIVIYDSEGSHKGVRTIVSSVDSGGAAVITIDSNPGLTLSVGAVVEILPPSFASPDRTTLTATNTRVTTALPNISPATSGGLATADANNAVKANVTQFGGTNGSFSGGRPEVNLTHAGGTAIGAEGTANFRHFLTDGYGPLLYRGTITAVTSSTVFTISGATFADVGGLIDGGTIVIYDSEGSHKGVRTIVSSADSGGAAVITIDSNPGLTLSVGAVVEILPPSFASTDRTALAATNTRVTTALPNASPGGSGGVFIAGTNAATSITGGLTSNITGNLSGSVGSVTGNVGGNVTGSVGSISGLTITSGRVNADVTH